MCDKFQLIRYAATLTRFDFRSREIGLWKTSDILQVPFIYSDTLRFIHLGIGESDIFANAVRATTEK